MLIVVRRGEVFPLFSGWDAQSLLQGYNYPSIKCVGTHLYTWVERGTVRVKLNCSGKTPASDYKGVAC